MSNQTTEEKIHVTVVWIIGPKNYIGYGFNKTLFFAGLGFIIFLSVLIALEILGPMLSQAIDYIRKISLVVLLLLTALFIRSAKWVRITNQAKIIEEMKYHQC
ncbi:hypothetical protein EWH99_00780 [Sporolactobacillus sp. THM7-7]|nr:hypothetical protein EWH99_00780 [Sporolactobacillus sp. THM7-7]